HVAAETAVSGCRHRLTRNRPRDDRLLDRVSVDEGVLLVLEGRAVHELLRHGEGAAGQLPLLRRAHVAGLPGLPERRRGDGRARCGRDPRRPEARLMAVTERTESDRIAAARERYVARGVATTPLVVAPAERARVWD